jgi:hypothetical protein
VQNFHNVANRNDDAFIDRLAKEGIVYVPFFPLGGFTPLQSSVLDRAAVSIFFCDLLRDGLASKAYDHSCPSWLVHPVTSMRNRIH